MNRVGIVHGLFADDENVLKARRLGVVRDWRVRDHNFPSITEPFLSLARSIRDSFLPTNNNIRLEACLSVSGAVYGLIAFLKGDLLEGGLS